MCRHFVRVYARPDVGRAVMTVLLCSERICTAYFGHTDVDDDVDASRQRVSGAVGGNASITGITATPIVPLTSPLPPELWTRVILRFLRWRDWPRPAAVRAKASLLEPHRA